MVYNLARVREERETREERIKRRKARKRGRPMARKKMWRRPTEDEIKAASGLNSFRVASLCADISWGEYAIKDALAFMDACGFDLMKLDKVNKYIKRASKHSELFGHLNAKQKIEFVKRLRKWKEPKNDDNVQPDQIPQPDARPVSP